MLCNIRLMITSEILGVRASPKGASPALKIDLYREPNSPAFAQISSFFGSKNLLNF
nr:MAG TPA: hypothetical protein [Bacteriophage sp.]